MKNDSNLNESNIFHKGTVLHSIHVDKFTKEANEYFVFESNETGDKFRIKMKSMLELAKEQNHKDICSLKINDGYSASGKMQAGPGRAVKLMKKEEFYECTFYEGEVEKEFDPKKVQRKSFIQVNRKHLESIFTFLILNDEILTLKHEEDRIERTTLELN
ncbi:hypothetical protein L5F50_01275 [Aliarcobacter butzleri]|nr:hypothetical protein [Aliarcobacter butzleri]